MAGRLQQKVSHVGSLVIDDTTHDRIFPYLKGAQVFCDLIPTVTVQVTIEGASPFLRKDRGERLAEEVLKHLT